MTLYMSFSFVVKPGEEPGRTSRIVKMKTMFALERHRNVVCGFAAVFISLTARIMAGCWCRVRTWGRGINTLVNSQRA